MIYDFHEQVLRKKQQLKKDIKNTAGKCAMILLLLSVSTYLLGSVFILILKIRGITLGIDMSINDDTGIIFGISKDAYNFWMGYFPCIAADIIAITVCAKIFKQKISTLAASQKEVSSGFVFSGALASIGVGIVSSIVFLIYSMIINSKGLEIPSPDFSIPKQKGYLILFFSYTCIMAPVFEEIIFRGYILNNMRRYGNAIAIIVSSVFFSMFHFNLVQLVNPIFMGIMLSFIAIKSESIIPSIIVHMFNNIMAMLSTVISCIDSNNLILLWSSLYYICGISALFYFIVKYGRELVDCIKERQKKLKLREKVLYSFVNKWGIIYALFYILIIFVTMAAKNA